MSNIEYPMLKVVDRKSSHTMLIGVNSVSKTIQKFTNIYKFVQNRVNPYRKKKGNRVNLRSSAVHSEKINPIVGRWPEALNSKF